MWQRIISYERWLIFRNEDASKKIFVAIGILVFDFELFIGGRVRQFLTASGERWLKCRNVDASKKTFVATEILVFDFELFIGGRLVCHEYKPVFSGHMGRKCSGLTVVRCPLDKRSSTPSL